MRRNRGRASGPPPPAAPLSEASSQIILLGLIAHEAHLRCEAERARIEAILEERIRHEAKHYGSGDQRWAEERRLWDPVSCTVDFQHEKEEALVAAPLVRIQAEGVRFTAERSVTLSICKNGILRVRTTGWPPELQVPAIGARAPKTIAEAGEVARRFLAAALPPIFALGDPTTRNPRPRDDD